GRAGQGRVADEWVRHARREHEAVRIARQRPERDPDVPPEPLVGDPEVPNGGAAIELTGPGNRVGHRLGAVDGEANAEARSHLDDVAKMSAMKSAERAP